MTTAIETWTKQAAETKDIVCDCAGDLANGETIASIDNTAHAPAGLTITGVARNSALIEEPGKRPIQANEAIQAFVAGGTAGVTYTITFSYTTSTGQVLLFVATLKVL